MNDPKSPRHLVLSGIACSACGGEQNRARTCDSCRGTGSETIRGCPQEHVPRDVWDAVVAASMAEQGTWPVSGGWLDQTAIFVESYRIIHGLS